ncbi:hypothetical protein [Dongia sp.]|jgi:hypothetical protein|uniref:hypothetical protein n=1 Tax=Dongia sp. TaxID=1977262 RepID=UPI0034A1CB26
MRIAVLIFLLASFLVGCASSGTTTSYNQYPEQYDAAALSDAAHQAKLRLIGAKLRLQLSAACEKSDPSLPSWSQSFTPEAIQACYDSKIRSAFNEPLGEASCAGEPEGEPFFTCLMAGSYLNDMLRNMNSPKTLSAEEWQDLDLAVKNVNAEITAQSIFQCAKSDITNCQVRFLFKAFGLGDEAGELCAQELEAMRCLLRKSVTIFIDDRTRLIW